MPFSDALMARLDAVKVVPPAARPRILFGADDVAAIRLRAQETPGVTDTLRAAAEGAAADKQLFGEDPEIPYLTQGPLRALAQAAFVLEDESFAARALEGVEVMFGFPPEEWVARPHRPMRCDHAMLNVASTIGISMDLCAPYWGEDSIRSISRRINDYTVSRFLETWEKQDAHWSQTDYHWNWKIMCCGEMGSAALACADEISSMDEVMTASLAGCLDILDSVPPEGDWAEGPGYWLATLGHGLRFALALARATDGAVDLFEHPALKITGDYIVHVTEPDEMVYDFNDNAIALGSGLDYLSLLASRHRRGDWARTARQSRHVSLERLAWDDVDLSDAEPEETARSFPSTGVVLMRSGWDEKATFVGLKSGRSEVGHSQLDANSFVVTSRGERLLLDEGIWPYAHFLGFFDSGGGKRFNFDGNATIAHNTLMVDGEGQRFGEEYPGRILSLEAGDEVDIAVAEGASAYAGRLKRYTRTLAFVKPDCLLVYDQVVADRPRLLEWLFHHRGEVSGDEALSLFEKDGVTLSLARVLPAEAEAWRVSDVTRTSAYTDSNALLPKRPTIRYRSFGPFHQSESMDVLWAIHVGDETRRPVAEAAVQGKSLSVKMKWADGSEKTVQVPRA
jgi:hypothetical protein